MRCTPPAGLPPTTRIVATGGAAGRAGAVCVPVVRAACVACADVDAVPLSPESLPPRRRTKATTTTTTPTSASSHFAMKQSGSGGRLALVATTPSHVNGDAPRGFFFNDTATT